MDTFQGIPPEAFRFYAELEQNNNREWWLEHKDTYDAAVREPLTALLERLEPQFGPAKIFRPYRDVRFSPDKTPYKTAQGAFAAEQEGVGFYLHLAADGLTLGGGYHSHSPAQLARFRESVDAPGTGEALQDIVDGVAAAGYSIGGETLKTVPRGFDKDHPRAELLKHKSLSAGLELGEPGWLSTPAAVDEIAGRWEVLRPLVDWVSKHAAP
ncbi:DUF2461 domain-containing protein [Arthrobacter cupressi]|uniref:TIGR02453 family protein n=1 Tax=Arthrobacter cupressi TaxID=1045773 RepID=A0A1G8Y402_9MICC|nr:DUF2461 domain-containing protein [Arthrobacter cupressi]NYD77081.1 uncharacterized protein (TIGR02453 family) [Arthrobacter cupressi]SDJ97568.1 TIGR02453 family protein [Arthrobacter cupressi]